MDVVEDHLENLRKEFQDSFVKRDYFETLEYKLTRKVNEIERQNQLFTIEFNSIKAQAKSENMNINELKTQVFEQNSLIEEVQQNVISLEHALKNRVNFGPV